MGLVRRTSALALVVTLSVLGIPLPAHAGEESPPLTLNGHPLSQLLNRAAPGDPFRLAGPLVQETGQISGIVSDSDGQPLANLTVQLTRIVVVGGTRGEQLPRSLPEGLTIRQAATVWNVSKSTAARWITQGTIPRR